MNIEYEVTVEDDLNAQQTFREWKLNRPLIKWTLRAFLLCLYLISFNGVLWGITHTKDPYSIYIVVLWLFCLGGCTAILFVVNPKFLQSSWNRRLLGKKWSKYYLEQNKRNISVTETEFIFATDKSERAWKWRAVKSLYEGTNGFTLCFFSMHKIFISKRAFITQSHQEQFENIIRDRTRYETLTSPLHNFEDRIRIDDSIEANQLKALKSNDFKVDLFICIVCLFGISNSFCALKTLFFLVFGNYQQIYCDGLGNSENVFYLLLNTILFLFYFGRIFPKLNPLAYWNTKQDLQKNFVKREPRQISITSEGVAIASKNYRQYLQWQSITKTAENKKIFLLYHSRNNEYTVIPKRIFSREAELIDFRNLANSPKNRS